MVFCHLIQNFLLKENNRIWGVFSVSDGHLISNRQSRSIQAVQRATTNSKGHNPAWHWCPRYRYVTGLPPVNSQRQPLPVLTRPCEPRGFLPSSRTCDQPLTWWGSASDRDRAAPLPSGGFSREHEQSLTRGSAIDSSVSLFTPTAPKANEPPAREVPCPCETRLPPFLPDPRTTPVKSFRSSSLVVCAREKQIQPRLV